MKALAKISAGLLTLVLGAAAFAADPAAPVSTKPATVSYLAVLQNGFSIRHIRKELRPDGVTRLYTSAGDYVDVPSVQIASFEAEEAAPQPPAVQPPAPAPAVPQLIDVASGKHLVDADFIRSVIRAESGFNPKAVSPKGAQGLMQLMPGTAQKLGVSNSFDPAANIDGGTRYLRELLMQYNGDAVKALAAYNAGPQRVTQYRGVPPYRETRAYVRRVINDYNKTKTAQKKSTLAKPAPVSPSKTNSPAGQ